MKQQSNHISPMLPVLVAFALPLVIAAAAADNNRCTHWNKQMTKACQMQFDLFEHTNNAEGWDPTNNKAKYVKRVIGSTDNVVKVFLHKKLGGHHSNENSDKAINGYHRTSSKYFVHYAQAGVGSAYPVHCCFVVLSCLF